MRREVLYSAVSRIIADLESCEIPELFDGVIEIFRHGHDKKEESGSIPLSTFKKYMLATHYYSEAELEVCRIAGISILQDIHFWESMSTPSSPSEIFEVQQSVLFATRQLPKLLSLIQQDYVQSIKDQKKELPEELKGKTLLSILIVEEKEHFSSPIRLTRALESITNLYSVFACLEGESENDLIVLACDSGSDKSFDFLGLAKLTEQVKETIIAIYDRRVFHRQRHVSESLMVIAESLPVLERIEQLKENGSLEPEQAELLKRKTIAGATQFIEAGAIIPELDSVSTHNPKQLMKPEPKLLVSPWNEDSEAISQQSAEDPHLEDELEDESELSDDEIKLLDGLLKKAKSKPQKKEKPTVRKKQAKKDK